jgi:hypothetical protein
MISDLKSQITDGSGGGWLEYNLTDIIPKRGIGIPAF